jgi:hypothetical protein
MRSTLYVSNRTNCTLFFVVVKCQDSGPSGHSGLGMVGGTVVEVGSCVARAEPRGDEHLLAFLSCYRKVSLPSALVRPYCPYHQRYCSHSSVVYLYRWDGTVRCVVILSFVSLFVLLKWRCSVCRYFVVSSLCVCLCVCE